MNPYEGMFVVDPALGKEELDKLTNQLKEAVTTSGGSVEQFSEWGKRALAYALAGRKEGLYYLMTFQADPQAIKRLTQTYRLIEHILRSVIVRRK